MRVGPGFADYAIMAPSCAWVAVRTRRAVHDTHLLIRRWRRHRRDRITLRIVGAPYDGPPPSPVAQPRRSLRENGEPMQLVKPFRTSSHTVQNEACVEVGATSNHVVVQDSKFQYRSEQSPVLAFRPTVFAGLVGRIKTGQLDL